MPELTPRELTGKELKIATLKAWGCELASHSGKAFGKEYVSCTVVRNGVPIGRPNMESLELAWESAPNVHLSLDACKPLIEEMRKAGCDIDLRIEGDSVFVEIYFYDSTLKQYIGSRDAEVKIGADAVIVLATAFCRAYLKFKELTTKEETK